MGQPTVSSALGLALGVLLWGSAMAEPGKNYPELSALFYDFEVAGYCGLVTNQVGHGFRQRTARLVGHYLLDQEAVNQLRGDAWQAAHAEWQNRGLGGFKNWCRTEGRAAAKQLEGTADPGP